MSQKWEIAFREVVPLYDACIRRDKMGCDSRCSQILFCFRVWREQEKKMLFYNREKDTIPFFKTLRKLCDWISVQERK